MWINCVYHQKLSTDIELPPQMGREFKEINRWKPNFEHKIDNEGVKIVY